MSAEEPKLSGPDLAEGVASSTIADGEMLLGHCQGEAVLLARRAGELFAIGAFCTHYGAPLEQGLLVDDTVRCPWHHACFSLRTGAALRAPALNPVTCWRVEETNGRVRVREKWAPLARPVIGAAGLPASVVIVGGGAAGNAAAETLRLEGLQGTITMLSADDSVPCDRPNLSKDYLAGTAPAEWIPLRPEEFYREQRIDLRLGVRVVAIDTAARTVRLANGGTVGYEALLLATGAEPVRVEVPGATLPHVHYLRTLADSRAIVAAAASARHAVVVGASFIGLEVAAALRAREIDVHVVGLEAIPMERILGADVGRFIRELHESHGVSFHLSTTVTGMDTQGVTLANGERIESELVIVGIGVRPATVLAEQAGLAVDRGVSVDEFLATSAPGVYAAGDIARWPDRHTSEKIRVEHWVVAQRQGQTAARNILGRREPFDAIPFFWTEQYDFGIAYVGHAERWDRSEIEGRLEERDCTVSYNSGNRTLAVAVVHRDLVGLRAEERFERAMMARRTASAPPS